jgi:hypothetical protein
MKKYGNKFSDKKNQLLLLLLTVIQCKQRYYLAMCRSEFKIIFWISETSKFSIMQD